MRVRQGLATAALLGLLASCASPGETGTAACHMTKVATIPLVSEEGFIAAPVTIDDKARLMLVDTGAERTLVTPSTVSTLHLEEDAHRRSTLRGTGGSVATRNAKLQSFGLGGVVMLDQSYAVGQLPSRHIAGQRAAGLIGADWLSGFDVDLDLPHRQMTLYRVDGCDGDYLPWAGARSMVTTYRYGRGLVLVKLTLDGAPVTALLDSGANHSAVTENAAARAGAEGALLAHEPVSHGVGVDGAVVAMRVHRFDRLLVGKNETDGMRMAVGPVHMPQGSEMLLGLDWLRFHRVWIDYRDRRLFVQDPSSAG